MDRLYALPRYATICGVAWLGSMFLWMTPALFLAIRQGFGWSTIDTAYVTSALLMTGGVGLLVINLVVRRVATATVAIIGGGLELAGLLTIVYSHGFWSVTAGATLAGLGSGFVMSCAPRIAAGMPVPERGYAAAGVTNTIMAAASFMFAATLSAALGPFAMLWLHVGMICVVLPPVVLGLRGQRQAGVAEVVRTVTRTTSWPAVYLMIFGHFLFSLAMGSYWAYIGPAAQSAGLTPLAAGNIVSAATLISLVGPLLAVWMGVRFGRTVPLTVAKLLFGACAAATLIAFSPVQYALAITVTSALIPPIIAFEAGAIVQLDTSSRGANVMAAIGYFLNGAGAVVGALLMGWYGLAGLAGGVVALCLVSAVAQVRPLRLLDRADPDGAADDRPDPEQQSAASRRLRGA